MPRRNRRPARPLTLSPLNRLLPLARYRDVRHVDTWEPVDFPTAPYPERAHVLNAVTQRVDGLAANGAVDSELGHVCDAEIDAWLDQWKAQAEYDLRGKLRVLAQLEAASREELTRRTAEDRNAQAALHEAETEYAVARHAYFDGAAHEAPPASSE